MKIEIAEHGRMTESGSSLLRLIQNQDIPLLDLLVRESVQNSLDAASRISEDVKVDITVGTFKPEDLNRHFDKIDAGLDRRYHGRKYDYIAVRDSNTVGLTGPVRYAEVKNNDFGNLMKLVYEICKPQANEGAGGSWGLGKTIYFRLGIGLVIYYSRIFQNGKYQSRLAACLVENETLPNALINNRGVKRGIAWWGQRDGLTSSATIPLNNAIEIQKILDVFGIKAYEKKETGTTIIIPYIDPTALLDEVYAKNEAAEGRPYWTMDVAEYLKVAIQRWYSPRLNNTLYPYGPYLSASINGKKITVSSMLSMFRYIRELYILSTGHKLDEETLLVQEDVQYRSESIDLRGVLNTTSSGVFSYAKFGRKQLMMEPPCNQKSPYQQVLNTAVQMEGGNGPIVTYTRRPGMIVGYDYDGTWTHHMPKSNPDEYIIGIFVANSDNTLKNIQDSRTGKPMTLEEYIRQGEKADHASWTDRNISGNNPRIISNIQKHVINKIKKQYSEPVKDNYERQNVGLGHALANILLPASDFGPLATPPGGGGGGSDPVKPKRPRKSALRIIGNPKYADGSINFDFEIFLNKKPCLLSLRVLTDFKRYEADAWESDDEIGKVFPFEFREIRITGIQRTGKGKKTSAPCDILITPDAASAANDDVTIELQRSERFSTCSYARIEPLDTGCTIRGNFTFAFQDPGLKGACDLKEIDNE